jgi:hypothetical protein
MAPPRDAPPPRYVPELHPRRDRHRAALPRVSRHGLARSLGPVAPSCSRTLMLLARDASALLRCGGLVVAADVRCATLVILASAGAAIAAPSAAQLAEALLVRVSSASTSGGERAATADQVRDACEVRTGPTSGGKISRDWQEDRPGRTAPRTPRVATALLRSGDRLCIGHTVLRCLDAPPPTQAASGPRNAPRQPARLQLARRGAGRAGGRGPRPPPTRRRSSAPR